MSRKAVAVSGNPPPARSLADGGVPEQGREPALAVRECTVRFGGVTALETVSMEVNRQDIHAIIGPNGAGKTTLFNAITGLVTPTSGSVELLGRDISRRSPYRRAQAGMARTFQNVRLFKNLNVLENVMSGRYSRTRSGFLESTLLLPRDRAERSATREKATELLEYLGVADRMLSRPTEIPYGDQRRVEIARALASEPELLLLDEPTAGMTARESDEMLDLITRLRDDGKTVVLIEHNMRLVMRVAYTITVLNFGRKLAEGTPEQIRSDERVVEAYLGVDE